MELRSRVSESCLAVVWGSETRGRGTGAAKPAVVVRLHLCALMVVSISNSLGSAAAMTTVGFTKWEASLQCDACILIRFKRHASSYLLCEFYNLYVIVVQVLHKRTRMVNKNISLPVEACKIWKVTSLVGKETGLLHQIERFQVDVVQNQSP